MKAFCVNDYNFIEVVLAATSINKQEFICEGNVQMQCANAFQYKKIMFVNSNFIYH